MFFNKSSSKSEDLKIYEKGADLYFKKFAASIFEDLCKKENKTVNEKKKQKFIKMYIEEIREHPSYKEIVNRVIKNDLNKNSKQAFLK